MSGMLYLEDLEAGQTYASGSYAVTAANIKEFAGQWDPQPFHMDEAAGEVSFFNGLAASGWHTACATMRLFVTGEFRLAGGTIGAGVEELRWFRPVRAGDVLTVRVEVLEVRAMKSRPSHGIARVRVNTLDAAGEVVQTFTSPLVVAARGA